ncbi:MAG: alpha-E domain-containing protein [Porticoccaceae bacterium]|nr:alpha-E domain-containing protein [Porticoccaceae bacterium]
MLSRVAERLYWMSRYLERVENTARLIDVYTNLLLDMPSGVNIGWYNLVTLNDAEEWFDARYKVRDERNVLRFLLSDPDYPGSMIKSLKLVRENIRTSRDVIPSESWEYINELSLYVNENLQKGVNRGARHDFIGEVIKSCQLLTGLFIGTMSEGQAKSFLRLGRNIERADMATRILDAGATVVLENDGNLLPTVEQIVWANVLHSASAYLPFTKSQRKSVNGSRVASYLLEDNNFPRAVGYCLEAMENVAEKLPRNQKLLAALRQLMGSRFSAIDDDEALIEESFRDYLNNLQLQIATLHQLVADTWFELD